MLKQQFPTHFFHAYGYALGGTINKPFQATVESQAATCISSVGGHATATADKFDLRGVIRFAHASTQIAAVEEANSFDTVITSIVDGLNIFNQFTVDRMVAHLSIKAMKDGSPGSFRTLGTRFEGMKIAGADVKPAMIDEDGLQYASKPNPVFDICTGKPIPQVSRDGRAILTTLVENLNVSSKGVRALGNAVYVPDFGVVYLAEYLVTPYERHLNMFRVQLGCGVDGRSSGSGVGGNGSSCPPPP